jgi:phasin family protein
MFSFTQQTLSPAVKSQLEAQFSFMNEMSRKMFESAQKINELNMQVAETVFEESLASTRQLFSATNQHEAISIMAGQSQPAAEKIRAYQQHVQNILAEAGVGMAKTLETHAPEATRAAEATVREVAQKASEETMKATQRQKEAVEKLTTPIKQAAERTMQGQRH